jgi:hypothetical protein
VSFAQVGIGTTSPQGVLDINSSTYGVVYPSVALTATNVATPVVNPLGGPLAEGTTVFNTNTTNTGANDVEPGIYSWGGSEWVIHFFKRQQRMYPQTSVLRSDAALGYQDVPGIGAADARNFTAKYSGRYRIEIKMTYGGGDMVTTTDVETTMAQGNFRFTFDGTPYIIGAKSFSTFNNYISGGRQFTDGWIQTTRIFYVNLVQNQNYNFSLEFDQLADPKLQAGGSLIGVLDGRGYVGSEIPCYIEISYLGE